MYSYEYAYGECLKYFKGDDLACDIFLNKYALRDKDENLLEATPHEMHWRLAYEFARIEKQKYAGTNTEPMTADEIFSLFKNFERIIPQGSPMYGIGNPHKYVSIGNCFVIPSPLDSYAGILYSDTQISQISMRRGGVGWDISKLRPKDTSVRNAARTSTGAISFMKRFSNTIREVGQSGRRGASLISIAVNHPDILDFIAIKKNLTEVTGSNISIRFTDEFMKAVENDHAFTLQWPVCQEDADEMKVDFPVVKKSVRAKEIWNAFIESAHAIAEPGAMYWDTVLLNSTCYPYRQFGHKEVSSNPCGEQFLPAYASCRLIMINLYHYVMHKFTTESKFNFISFCKDVYAMQRLADDMVDLEIECINRILDKIESDPEPQHIKQIAIDLWKNIRKTAYEDRRTGCGLTGLGDCLAALGIQYGSEKSIEFVEQMQKEFKWAAYSSSVHMAKTLGAFPLYNAQNEQSSLFILRLSKDNPELYKEMIKYGRRNMVLLTIAPTGTTSCLTRTSSGLEPVFKLKYMRRKKGNPGDVNFRSDFIDQNGDHWMHYVVNHRGFQDWQDVTGKTEIDESPYYKSCAEEIDWINRVKMQGALNRHIDNSISATVNLPENVTIGEVDHIYMEAWRQGLKGITTYRANCRTGVLVDVAKDIKVEEPQNPTFIKHNNAPKRPKQLKSDFHHTTINGKKYVVIVGLLENVPYEVFLLPNIDECGSTLITKDYVGGFTIKQRRGVYTIVDDSENLINTFYSANHKLSSHRSDIEEAVARLTSVSLRHGAHISFIVEQLDKSSGNIRCFCKSIARILKLYIQDGTKVNGESCPECQTESLVRQDGCVFCTQCGYSKC